MSSVCLFAQFQIQRAQRAVETSGMNYKVLDVDIETTAGMFRQQLHLAKGLEFRAVALWPVMTK